MIGVVLNTLKTTLLTNNPNTFSTGFAGARQLEDGKIIIDENGEFKYVGLGDTNANFFYIRFLDDIEPTPSDVKIAACVSWDMEIPLRLVAWVSNANEDKLLNVLLNDLYSGKIYATGYGKIQVFTPTSILFDREKIYREETNQDEIHLAKNVSLIAIDFRIMYKYTLKNSDCLDREVCVPC